MPIVAIESGDQFTVYAWGDDDDNEYAEFLAELFSNANSDAQAITKLVERTAHHGPPQNITQCRYLNDDIYEFKARNGARVLWFYDEGRIIICTHGFVKKKDKTPKEQIEKAVRIKDQYFKEKKSE